MPYSAEATSPSSEGLQDSYPPPKPLENSELVEAGQSRRNGPQEGENAEVRDINGAGDSARANADERHKGPMEKFDGEDNSQSRNHSGAWDGTSSFTIVDRNSEVHLHHRRKETMTARNAAAEVEREVLISGRRPGHNWDHRVRWAPLNIPLKRRLQTGMVLFHTLCIALFLSTFFLLCSIPLFWPLLLPYLVYCLFSTASTSGTLSHRSSRLRSLPIWSLFASYFPARLHRSQELPPTRKYIFGYHPHGIISHGAFAAFATEALGFAQLFPGITNTLLTLDANFRLPLYRDYALAMGLASVSRESCENLLSRGGANGEGMGRAITIVVGGARESLDAQPGALRLVLAQRKGFIKLAIRTGADLVPVLAFGENELYKQVEPLAHPLIYRAQMALKRVLGFTVPLFHARGVFNYDVGLLPYRHPLHVVVGRPLKVLQDRTPEPAYVDAIHAEYVAELTRVWDEWKDEFAPRRAGELEITA
ncbi:MAG: diacylglycerol O-acyltransferase 1 [Trizodia sp. TS-e1964]|nr:MAG: diacylglycerol O-acyltransferase 1 [Trizodia sp. TS-e1964]